MSPQTRSAASSPHQRALLNGNALSRALVAVVLSAAFGLQMRSQWQLIEIGTQSFLIGDWMISYAGGFVRRGLFGSMLIAVANDAAAALMLLFAVQTLLYFIIFAIAMRWVFVLPGTRDWSVFFLSPAFLLFGLGDFLGTHRKEIIGLCALFLLAEWVRTGCNFPLVLPIVVLLFLVAVFSHEANALLVAPLLILLRQARHDESITRRFTIGGIAALSLISLIGLVTAFIAPGTSAQRSAICHDLIRRGFDETLCSGAISYLGQGGREALLHTASRLPDSTIFAALALFALAPFTLAPWARNHVPLLVIASAPILPLFLLGIDWGRWIMIATVISTVLVVVGSSREGSTPDRIPLPWIAVFVLTWRIPHYQTGLSQLGPSGLLAQGWGFFLERLGDLVSLFSSRR